MRMKIIESLSEGSIDSFVAGIRDAYITGYMRGHHDTVESCYGSPEDNADDYIESAMCEANSNAVLDDVVKLLTEYTQYLYKFGYLDDDWIMEASSPIQEFINKKFGNVV